MDYFFVYGTLKRGHGNNRLLAKAQFVDQGVTVDNYTLYHLGCPGAVRNADGHPILGEVFAVDDAGTVQNLDWLESNGSFYTRYQRPILLDNGEVVTAWIYELPDTRYGMAGYCDIDEERGAYVWERR
jgi:gamma-glutamylcyclotransferase (GGCT)/AIG2-like uncharacterized protein YtfP